MAQSGAIKYNLESSSICDLPRKIRVSWQYLFVGNAI